MVADVLLVRPPGSRGRVHLTDAENGAVVSPRADQGAAERPSTAKKTTGRNVVLSGDTDQRRTPGGWKPVGTAAQRRAAHSVNGTERGRQSRHEVIVAARTIFERDGFFDARIEDIVTQADVARGTFYTYFSSKIDVLDAVSEEFGATARVELPDDVDALSPTECADYIIRNYLHSYRLNARLLEIITQVATNNPAMQSRRLRARQDHVDILARLIDHWRTAVRPGRRDDSRVVAASLVSMLTNFAYWWIVGGDEYDEATVVSSLTHIWVDAIGLQLPDNDVAQTTSPIGGPQLGPLDRPSETDSRPRARRGYWK